MAQSVSRGRVAWYSLVPWYLESVAQAKESDPIA